MMLTHLRFAGSIGLLLAVSFACKSYEPNKTVRESFKNKGKNGLTPAVPGEVVEQDPNPVIDSGPENSLIIKKLNLPTEVARYNRNCLIIQTASKVDQVIKSYKLDDPIEVEPTQDYKLTLEVYQDDVLRYSNAYCNINQSFNAEVGRNIFTVSVCAPTDAAAKASDVCKS